MKNSIKQIIYAILRFEAKLVLLKYKPKIIAITGSVGKTSTKDAIFAVLSPVYHVRKSDKSYNGRIGLPLTILGCPNGWNNIGVWVKNVLHGIWLIILPHKYPEWLILEVGISKPGDMKVTALWLKTDIVVVTTIGETPVHIEFFNSRKMLVDEKASLISTLKKDGTLILNSDDEAVLNMREKTKNTVLTFGLKEGADMLGSASSISYDSKGVPEGVVFHVDIKGNSLPVLAGGVFGQSHVYASLAALSATSALKLNILNAINALKKYDVPAGRMRLLSGINGSLIVDDTYNSSPVACEAALKTLGEVVGGRKIAVLGDMLELGKHTGEAHKNIGKIARGVVDVLVVVGPRSQAIKDGAFEKGIKKSNVFEFSNSIVAGEFLKTFVKNGDIVLIKGSQSMRMEKTTEAVMADLINKSKLLVRQEEEWLNK